MGFLADTETAVTTGFTAVANTFGSGLLATFRPAFIIGFTIWITLIAYEVAFGKSEDSFTYLFTKIGKMFLIGILALYGWPDVANILGAVKDGFVGSNTMSTVLETNLMNPIGDLWAALFDWYTSCLKDVGWTELGRLIETNVLFALLFLADLLLSAVVALFGVIALAMFLVANTTFILLMAIGPFFLLCLAFPFLQKYFETFIGNVVTTILAMAFTVLMVMFVANLFGLTNIQTIVPSATDQSTIAAQARSMSVFLVSKAAMTLLIIYMYYKVFDLASALGGGMNMGNNLVGGVRGLLRDAQRSAARASNGNAVSQGSGGGGASGSAGAGSGRAGGGPHTLTGMGVSALASGMSSAARGGMAVGATAAAGTANVARIGGYGAGRAAAAATNVGRYAYNRVSQMASRSR